MSNSSLTVLVVLVGLVALLGLAIALSTQRSLSARRRGARRSPLPVDVAHRLAEQLSAARKDGSMAYLRPDGKTQVTIEYEGDKPVRLETVVVSSQHAGDIDLEAMLAPDVRKHVVEPVLERYQIDSTDYQLLVNPTGRFEIGGPMGDAGLTDAR